MKAKTLAKLALVKIDCMRETAKERDRRYKQRFEAQESAVVLAREIARELRGKVSIMTAVSAVSALLALIGYFK